MIACLASIWERYSLRLQGSVGNGCGDVCGASTWNEIVICRVTSMAIEIYFFCEQISHGSSGYRGCLCDIVNADRYRNYAYENDHGLGRDHELVVYGENNSSPDELRTCELCTIACLHPSNACVCGILYNHHIWRNLPNSGHH